MKRTGLAILLSACALFAVARGQDDPTKTKPEPPKAEKKDEPPAKKADSSAKAPDPSKAAPAGDVLKAGTVDRKQLYPLDDGRTWRYELKTWLATSAPEEGAPEETEPPRVHRMDVSVGDSIKIEGREARCLEWRLDDEPAQKAYYFEDAGQILCARRILGAGEHAHDYALTPAQPVLQGELAVGANWSWSGKVGPSAGKQRFEVLREEQLKVAGKTYDCVVVRMTFSGEDDSSGVSVKWLSPGVGIVREETEVKADQQVYRTLAVLQKFETAKK